MQSELLWSRIRSYMIPFQASPVVARNSVINAGPNDWKFTCRLRLLASATVTRANSWLDWRAKGEKAKRRKGCKPELPRIQRCLHSRGQGPNNKRSRSQRHIVFYQRGPWPCLFACLFACVAQGPQAPRFQAPSKPRQPQTSTPWSWP